MIMSLSMKDDMYMFIYTSGVKCIYKESIIER